jgi:TolB-like protein/DNA-binding winged helix-turn-helix (wHTH) protein/Tfp pilus assembly protein PilF
VSSSKLRFDGWVLDSESGELEHAGRRVRLQEQPVLVLRELIAHAGSVVTREQLIALLWPKGVVDFDTGLNTVIRKLRGALGDLAETPRYIETLPRRGYRFIGTLDPDPEAVSAVAPSAELPVSAPGEASLGVAHSTPGSRTSPVPARVPPDLPLPTERPVARDEPPSSVAADAAAPRRSLLYPALIAALAVVALLIGVYAAWRTHSAASMRAVRVEAPAPSALPAHTVAVLPFENLSAEPSDGFLATGIAESVLHRLASVKSLSVIARTSSFTFRGRDVDVRDIGRQLNARYLVEGSVQRAGNRLRVTAQLLDASSGSDVWSLRLERSMGDIFELQDEISGKVTDAIGVSLAAEPGKTSPQRTPKLDAYLAYIEGRSLLSTFKIADAETGIERVRGATSIDPNFAAAYVEEAHGLRTLQWLLHPDPPPDPQVERQATALVDKALSLDPELGEAWVELAWGRQQTNDAYDAATDADFRKGLALVPNYAQGYQLYGEWLDGIGRTDDALPMIERARQLDPLAPRSSYIKGLILRDRGEVDHAVALFLEALRVNPTYHPALTQLGTIEAFRGNFAEGAKLTERAIAVDPKAEWIRFRAVWLYLNLGDVAAARDVLAGVRPEAAVRLCLFSYLGDEPRGAAQLYALPQSDLKATVLSSSDDCPSAVIRDDALKRGDYGPALRALEACLTEDLDLIVSHFESDFRATCAIRYASILMAKGERNRARKLLHAMLTAMQRYKIYDSGRGAQVRGVALALLGDTDGALKALELSFAAMKGGWWYELERSPDFKGLHSEPRFQSLLKQYQDIVAKQSALLAEMRRAGEVPYRPPQSATTSRN